MSRHAVKQCAPLGLVLWPFLLSGGIVGWLVGTRGSGAGTYFRLYHPDMAIFDGAIRVHTLGRFIVVGVAIMGLNVLDSFVGTRFRAWRNNYLYDHKTPRSDIDSSEAAIHLTMQLYAAYSAAISIIGIMVSLTSIYFILLSAFGNTLVTYATTDWFLREKRLATRNQR